MNIKTEGIKYAGSKLKLISYILNMASKVQAHSVFDAFSGTTRISQAFAKNGYKVISNDIAIWSKVFSTCYLLNKKEPSSYVDLIAHLNNVKSIDGWYTSNYGNGLQKKPWQLKNTRKLDGIREEIDKLSLSEIDKSVALTALILALDKVDSTIGHYASYLKEWSPRSYNDLLLKVPEVFTTEETHTIYFDDIFNLLPYVNADLAYLDPPYGSSNDKMPPSRIRYASYYHLWTTICLNDKPALFGKTNRRCDASDKISPSVFEEFRKNTSGRFMVAESIEKMLADIKTKWVILSYGSSGRIPMAEMVKIIQGCGTILETQKIDYKKNVMAEMKWTNEWVSDSNDNFEFLFLIEKK